MGCISVAVSTPRIVVSPSIVEKFEAEMPPADGNEGTRLSFVQDDDLEAAVEGGGEGDVETFGGYPLGEAEERVDVSRSREGDEEDMRRNRCFFHDQLSLMDR